MRDKCALTNVQFTSDLCHLSSSRGGGLEWAGVGWQQRGWAGVGWSGMAAEGVGWSGMVGWLHYASSQVPTEMRRRMYVYTMWV